jgi:hypothetical protein
MKRTGHFYLGTAAAVGVAALVATPFDAQAQGANNVAIDNEDIGGVVRGPGGPEAGVWVIAETRDLPTRFTRSVVTDDQGRYVLPDLPKAKYKIWVRGYGLVDSAKVDSEPGRQLNLAAVPAPNEAAAAQYYPAIYWYSMMKIPDTDRFGGKGDIPANVTQAGNAQRQPMHRLSSARQSGHPYHPKGARRFQEQRRGLDAAHPIRAGRRDDDQRPGR